MSVKNIKKSAAVLLSAVMIVGIASGCSVNSLLKIGSGTKGDGNITSVEIAAKDFNGITASGVADINITFSDEFSVAVTTDSNIQEFVKVSVSGGVLNISESGSFSPTKLVIDVTMPNIHTISLSGAGNVTLADGEGESLDIKLSGVGNIHAKDYPVKSCSVSISGVGSVEVWATDSLDGEVSGVGELRYRGTPALNVKKSGVGGVSRLSD